jgi:hypothetical protein
MDKDDLVQEVADELQEDTEEISGVVEDRLDDRSLRTNGTVIWLPGS